MSLHSFMCTQRRKMVVMIFESLLAKYQRFTQVMQYAEDVAKKNSEQPEDDSVDSSLRHLKGLLQFNNSDSIAQIDLVLEQSDMASLYSLQKPRSSLIVLDDDTTSTQLMQEETRDRSLLSNRKTVIPSSQTIPTRKLNSSGYISEDNHKSQPQSSKITHSLTSILKTPSPSLKTPLSSASKKQTETLIVTNHQIVPAKRTINKSELLFRQLNKDKRGQQTKKKHKNRTSRHDGNLSRNKSILEKATYFINENEESKFKEYLEAIIEFEDNYQIKITNKFKDKNFFFLRTQNETLPIMSVLDDADKELIIRMTPHFQTQKGVADLLYLRPHLVSTVIAISKKCSSQVDGKERNSNKSGRLNHSHEEDENEEGEDYGEEEEMHGNNSNNGISYDNKKKMLQKSIHGEGSEQLNEDQKIYQQFIQTKIEHQDVPDFKVAIKQKE